MKIIYDVIPALPMKIYSFLHVLYFLSFTREDLLHFEKDLVEPKDLQCAQNYVRSEEHVQDVRFSRPKLLDNAIGPYIKGVLPKLKTNVPPTNDTVHEESDGKDNLATKDKFAIPGILLHMSWEEYFQITKHQEH